MSLASPRSVLVHDALNSRSRVARLVSDAEMGCCVVFWSGISQLLSRLRALAAAAAVSSSPAESPWSSPASAVTRAAALAAASSWLVNRALSAASCSFNVFSRALSPSDSRAPARTKRR